MRKMQSNSLSIVSKLLYDDFTSGIENEMPKDEYVPEAKAILEYIEQHDGFPTTLEINRMLTRIFKDYLGYEYTDYQLEVGDFPVVATKIHELLHDVS